MKTISGIIFLNVVAVCFVFINGCSVGALVNVKAIDMDYPVSHTNNFYSKSDSLVKLNHYEVQNEFSFSFTKWGVAFPLDIKREEDISKKLNNIIEKNNGDAIVDLSVSVSNPAINGFTFFIKTISFWTALVATSLTIKESSGDHAIIATSSIALYLFTPAAADIKIEGKVVKLLR
jgi:hypothetical protein